MKTLHKKFSSRLCLLIIHAILLTHVACSRKDFLSTEDRFSSASFNHFESGIFFTDVEFGLNILWEASFKERNPYKENLGFFVKGGLLILPNKYNTKKSARLGALPTKTDDGKLYVQFMDNYIQVFGMIHTHPDFYALREPASRHDYQYGNLGIHNYVMGHLDLFDAYKDSDGVEIYERLGRRNAYHKIPLQALTGE